MVFNDNELLNKEELINLIEDETDELKIKSYIEDLHPFDIASIFEELSDEAKEKLFKILSSEELADIIAYLDSEDAALYLEKLDRIKSTSILNEMDIDDATDIVKEFDNPTEIVSMLENEVKDNIDELSKYDDNTAGSIMTLNFITINTEMDVKDAMKIVVNNANEFEIIDPIFVLDNDKLVGVLKLKDLIIARSPNKIKNIMNTNFQSVSTSDSIDEVNNIVNNYDTYALPVIDDGVLKGVITIDDAFESIYESYKQNYKQMAAINDIEHDDTVLKKFIKRLPWLTILLILSLLITNVTGLFDEALKQVVVLGYFQTMLLDMAGNIGTQSLAVTIQKMSNQALNTKKDETKHILRELLIGNINSVILGVISFGVCLLYMLISYSGTESIYMISLVISLSLFITLNISTIISTVLPLLLRKIKIDPAVASGPFISTLNDIVSIIVYFNIAILLLGLVI